MLSSESYTMDPHIEQIGMSYKCKICIVFLNGPAQIRSHLSGNNHKAKERSLKGFDGHIPSSPVGQMGEGFQDTDLPPFIERHGLQFKCSCCDVKLNGKSQVRSHVSGNAHQAKERKSSNPDGPITVSPFSSGEPQSNSAIVGQMATAAYNNTDSLPLIERCSTGYRCTCCDVKLNSESQLRSHMSGSAHRAKEGKLLLSSSGNGVPLPSFRSATNEDDQEFSILNIQRGILPPFVERMGSGFKCTCCNNFLNSESQVINHFLGKNHKEKEKRFKNMNPSYLHSSVPSVMPTNSETQTFMEKPRNTPLLHYSNNNNTHLDSNVSVNKSYNFNSQSDYLRDDNKRDSPFDYNLRIQDDSRNPPILTSDIRQGRLPPLIEKITGGYKCVCCNAILNSESQVISHISGNKHVKARASFSSPIKKTASDAVSNFSSDIYAALENIEEDDVMSDLKFVKSCEKFHFEE